MRYFILVILISIMNSPIHKQIIRFITYIFQLRYDKITFIWITLAYKNTLNVFYCQNEFVNYTHIPIFISLILSNVLMTKDCLKFFIIHVLIGWIFVILSSSCKNKKIEINNI